MMLFHEIYGCYYNAVASILELAVNNELTDKNMKTVINEKAFLESILEIIPALKDEKWQLIKPDLTTYLKHKPAMPLTTLQKRWLKSISLDKRIKLFNVDFKFLSNVEPLFKPDDYVVFDKYNDGDSYEDENYIKIFRTVLLAIHEHKRVAIDYNSRKGKRRRIICTPYEMEYSEKDDKFRVNVFDCNFAKTLNVACIEQCEILDGAKSKPCQEQLHSTEYFITELIDERNALERFLLHFAHFKKEAEYIENNKYQIKIYSDKGDETELVIRILSFGQFVKVTEPESFTNLIKERLNMQKKLWTI